MSKKSLNLTIEEPIKRRAKRLARQRGVSVSQFFEEFVIAQEDPDEWTPTPGTAAYRIAHAIPESKKVDTYDYKKLKAEMLEERYGNT